MPPRRRGASGFRGVRVRPSGRFTAEIRAGGFRLTLGTYNTPEEAARAYDAAWRFRRPGHDMNFPDVESLEEAEFLAPPPCLVDDEDRRRHRQVQRRIAIAERDEKLMRHLAWHTYRDRRDRYASDAQQPAGREQRPGRAPPPPGVLDIRWKPWERVMSCLDRLGRGRGRDGRAARLALPVEDEAEYPYDKYFKFVVLINDPFGKKKLPDKFTKFEPTEVTQREASGGFCRWFVEVLFDGEGKMYLHTG
ncbi:hypothetical protein QYE76_046846 [Lolium multiflorum]|uniref:AP2/ERF domain-containing protein n=1 Tax=Lolium multiflorum TaxID=4521 RepID=A0AAD8X1F6_LOLMU|nr:hypothetical protein QYE76_046846 [Lolium multiflorum]